VVQAAAAVGPPAGLHRMQHGDAREEQAVHFALPGFHEEHQEGEWCSFSCNQVLCLPCPTDFPLGPSPLCRCTS
jgi:hypothetical protein